MVAVNITNIPLVVFPVNLYKQEKNFSLIPDWLKKRKELTQGFKNYYSEIQRKIGNRGFVFLKNETLAESISCHPKTISNYNKIAQHHNLITIIETGRGQLFVLNYHPWMEISEDQALKLKPQLPEKIIHLISKKAPSEGQIFPENIAQVDNNKEVGSTLENSLETSLIEKDKEAAALSPAPKQIGNSVEVEKAKESSENSGPIFQNEAASEEKNRGKFGLQDYLDYAATQPNIENVDRFAAWLLQTGKQDKNVGKFLRRRAGAARVHRPGGLENKSTSSISNQPTQTPINTAIEVGEKIHVKQSISPANQSQLQQLGAAAFFSLSTQQQLILLQLIAKQAQLSPDLPLESLKAALMDKISAWLGSFALKGDLREVEEIIASGDMSGMKFIDDRV